MRSFEASNIRPPYLEKLKESLKTISVTSIESERGFSVMGLFGTKIRNRLGPRSLNALLFMRQYLKNKK